MTQWQPIDTAPMGKRIILYVEGKVRTGGYDDHWTGQTWVYDYAPKPTDPPTHWMPLPAPPVPA